MNTINARRSIGFVSCFAFFGFLVVAFAQEPLPRFRAGANLVNVDAFFAKDGTAVSDLKPSDIEIFEDDQLQKIENFRIVTPARRGEPATRPNPVTVAEQLEAAADPEARVFALFFDQWHVSFDGSARAAAPVSEFLNRVIGPDDLVGVMTPEIPARSLPLTRRTDGIDRMFRDVKTWGERDRSNTSDPREREIEACYPDNDPHRPQFRGIAKEMIERRREQKTLGTLDDLIAHLGSLRDERKFVVLFSEGWVLFRQNPNLGVILEPDSIPGTPSIGVSGGRLTAGADANSYAHDGSFDSCERERSLLAFVDHSVEVRQLAQRANRANVTFFAIDPRGLAAFDDSIGPLRPALPQQDRERMSARQGGLRELAGNTEGAVVLNTNDVKGGLARMMSDLGAYYLMQYYSTNAKLDGKYRRITVKVKRPGIQVRARDGYLAPTEAEARSAGVPVKTPQLPAGVVPLIKQTQITALRRGPSTGLNYARATAPEFRRTERLRIEVPMQAGAANLVGHVLNARDQLLPLIVTCSTAENNGKTIGAAEVILAPLAVGEYQLSFSFDVNGETQSTVYAFRLIP
ncbi:MAG: VWA domain-containing protein [Acidobacteriota bacterium]